MANLRCILVISLAAFALASSAQPAAAGSADYCAVCEKLADYLEDKGTDGACSAIGCSAPPLSTVCDFLVDKLADWILDHIARGYNATTMCRQIGMCSSQGCPCGECQSPVYDKRCLSLPNKCPSTAAKEVAPSASSLGAKIPSSVRDFLNQFGVNPKEQRATPYGDSTSPMEFCFDGDCDSGHNGCCLTCF